MSLLAYSKPCFKVSKDTRILSLDRETIRSFRDVYGTEVRGFFPTEIELPTKPTFSGDTTKAITEGIKRFTSVRPKIFVPGNHYDTYGSKYHVAWHHANLTKIVKHFFYSDVTPPIENIEFGVVATLNLKNNIPTITFQDLIKTPIRADWGEGSSIEFLPENSEDSDTVTRIAEVLDYNSRRVVDAPSNNIGIGNGEVPMSCYGNGIYLIFGSKQTIGCTLLLDSRTWERPHEFEELILRQNWKCWYKPVPMSNFKGHNYYHDRYMLTYLHQALKECGINLLPRRRTFASLRRFITNPNS